MKPVMPAAAPAACGRTETAPASAFGSMKPDANPMIICGIMMTSGPPAGSSSTQMMPTAAPATVTATPARTMKSTPYFADQRPAAKLPDHVGERDRDEPEPVFGRGAMHDRDHDMRRAADESEEHRRIERRDQRVAEERAVAEQAARGGRGNARSLRPLPLSGSRAGRTDAQASTAAANSPMKAKIDCQPSAVSSAPPISGAIIGATTIAIVTQPDHRGGAVAIVKVADHRAPDHDAGGGAERLRGARHDRGRRRRWWRAPRSSPRR